MSLSGVGRIAAVTPPSKTRVDRRVPQARGSEVAAIGAVSGAAARGGADRTSADAAPLSHETAVLDLLRAGVGNPRQRRIPGDRRAGGAQEKTGADSRPET